LGCPDLVDNWAGWRASITAAPPGVELSFFDGLELPELAQVMARPSIANFICPALGVTTGIKTSIAGTYTIPPVVVPCSVRQCVMWQ
jgi:hypothetical protein